MKKKKVKTFNNASFRMLFLATIVELLSFQDDKNLPIEIFFFV